MISFVPATSSRVEVNGPLIERMLTDALTPGLEAIGEQESAAIKAALSVPVGRDSKGNVTQRSLPGEAPRLDTGELHTEIQYAILPTNGGPILEIGSARPSTPDVPFILEYQLNRPFMAPALLRMKSYALNVLAQNAATVLK